MQLEVARRVAAQRQRCVAQRAVAHASLVRLALVVAVLARAALRREVRLEDGLARDDARGEVRAALAAVGVPLLAAGAAARAWRREPTLPGVSRRVSGEGATGA